MSSNLIYITLIKKSIKTGLWIWKRWPVLKTLQIPLEGKMYTNLESFKFYHEVTVLLKQIDFETCESLEKVVLYDFNIWTSKTGKINELCFNPKIQSKEELLLEWKSSDNCGITKLIAGELQNIPTMNNIRFARNHSIYKFWSEKKK